MDWRNTYCEREKMKLTANAKGTDAARRYLSEMLQKAIGGNDFDAYIKNELAGDFAWNLVNTLLAASVFPDAPNPSVEPVAKYLVIAMDDDQRGHPVFCADENALHSAVRECMFMEGVELDPEENEQVAGTVSALIEDGHVSFEGDPGIHLYHLPEGYAAPLAQSAEQDRIDAERWRMARKKRYINRSVDEHEIDTFIAKGASK
jgi:hypothetical protein